MNVFLGKPKTGKSKYIYESIGDDLKKGITTILFVPSQLRKLSEEEYISERELDGVIGVNITTISSYVAENLKSGNLHFDDNYISKMDKKIILTQVVNENKELFKIFKNVINKQGFLDMLDIYMDILQKTNLSVDELSKIELKEKIVDAKLKEIISIYNKYKEKIDGKYSDSISYMALFLDKVLNNMDYGKTKIYFDSYNNFSEHEILFIKTLLAKNVDLTITLDTDITCIEDIYAGKTLDIFNTSNTTYLRLLKIANELNIPVSSKVFYTNYSKANKDLIFLADNIFSNEKNIYQSNLDNVNINIYSNIYDEVNQITKDILSKISQGYSYKDFCIYTTNMKKYSSIFARMFYEYNMELYADTKNSIENSILTKYILTLLNISLFGINIEEILGLLKLGLNDINVSDVLYFENYVKEFNISKYSLNKEFKINNFSTSDVIYDLEKINSTRIKIIEMFNLRINKNTKFRDIVKSLYEHLNKSNVFLNYLEKINDTNKNSYSIQMDNIEKQVWDKISEIFDSIVKIYDGAESSLEEFVFAFKTAIKDISIKTIPPTLDQVVLADINVSKIDVKKIVYFVGVIQDEFPKKYDQDVLFCDYELEKLEKKGLKLRETTLIKVNMELYNIYEALNNVCEKLYITIPSSEISGKSNRPSSLVNKIKELCNIKIIGKIAQSSQNIDSFLLSKSEMFSYLVQTVKNTDLSKISSKEVSKILALYKYFKGRNDFETILEYVKDDDDLDKKTIDTIYNNILNTSISRLELFKKCPFSYTMQYILNITPTKEYEISSMDIGSFMHEVLEVFSKYLLENKIAFQEILDVNELLECKYEEKLYEIIEQELDRNLKKHKDSVKYHILKEKLINTMKKVIVVIARSFNQSKFVPFGYEIEFKDGALFAPIEIKLSNDKYMKIVGKIDRIDVLEEEDKIYAKVVDYKSSNKNLNIDDIKEGLSLQLITYLGAFLENKQDLNAKKEVVPAGMLYFNLSNKLVSLTDYTSSSDKIEAEVIKSLRTKGIFLNDATLLEKMDTKFNDKDKRIIDVSMRDLEKKSNKTLEKQEFLDLCSEAKNILKNIANEVLNGVVKIKPNKKADYCKYCNYSNICRKNSCI